MIQGGLGQMVQTGEGQPATMDSGLEAWVVTYLHNQWTLGMRITQIAMEDELYGVAGRYATEMVRAAKYTQEVNAMAPFNNLAATVYSPNEGGSFPWFATNHYRIDGGTWSNKLASGADLSIESLELALTQWHTGMVDLRGRKIATEPVKLVVGPSDKWIAMRLVNSVQRPQTANNDVNPIHDLGLDVHVMSHLTDDGRWFLLGETEQTGLHWFNRRPVTVQRETPADTTGNLQIIMSARWSNGVSHPWNSYNSP